MNKLHKIILIASMLFISNIFIVHAQGLFDGIASWFRTMFSGVSIPAMPINNSTITNPIPINDYPTPDILQGFLNNVKSHDDLYASGQFIGGKAEGFLLTASFNKPIFILIHGSGIVGKYNIQMSCTSNSMRPTYNCDTTKIVYQPDSSDEIHVGDIIAAKPILGNVTNSEGVSILYAKDYMEHRVISKNIFTGDICVQGDNLPYVNYMANCGIRFENILYKVIGILY